MIKVSKIFGSNFSKSIIMITSGAAFAQILNIMLSPVITRLYTPEDYSIISIYTAVLSSLSFVGSFNFELAIPIAKDDDKAINAFVLSLITLILSTTIMTFILIFFGHKVLSYLNATRLEKNYLLIPLGIITLGVYNILVQWAYRKKDYKSITKTKFTQSIVNNIISIFSGVIGIGPIGLIIGKIFGQSGGISTLLYPLLKQDYKLFKFVKQSKIKESAKRYKDFFLYTTPRRYLGDMTVSLPILFITTIYGSEIVGLFGLANSVIQLPMNIIGNSISNVYYAECADLKNTNPKKILNLSNKLLRVLTLIGLIPFLLILILGPFLFGLVFGENWILSGNYARLLSIAVFFRFIFKPISNIFDIFEKQKLSFLLNIFRLFLVAFTFYVSYILHLNSYTAVGMYSIMMALIYFIQYLLALKVIKTFEY